MMINKLILGALVAFAAVPQAADAQLRSFQNSFSGREEKSGSGTIRSGDKDLRIERIFLRMDRNGDVFVRIYPQAFARTYSGRYHWESRNRIRVDLTEGISHAVGTIEMNETRDGEVTFGRIELRGETSSGNSQRVDFRPSNSNRPGSERETSVESWNRRWGSGNGGWGGSGGSGGGWGNNNDNDNDNWGGSDVNASTSGRGDIDWKGRDYRVDRANVRYQDGRAIVKLESNRGSIEIRSERARMNGGTFFGNIERFANQSSNGTISFRLTSNKKEVQSVTFNGRADGSNFRGSFKRN